MPYRRTDNVIRKQAARHRAIIAAARKVASEGGMAALQIVPVAERAGIAAGTVYRYFPSKTELVGALVRAVSETEIGAVSRAAEAAPGPMSGLAAAITTFAARALRNRRLAWAVLAEPVEPGVEALRVVFRQALAGEFRKRIVAAMALTHLPQQDADLSAAALVGALIEALLGPLAPGSAHDPARLRDSVQALTLFLLRGLGVVDARARGLVVQTAVPARDEG